MTESTPGELPLGWAWATLRELGTWSGGATPSKSNPSFWTDGTVPWLSPKDMGVPTLLGTRDKVAQSALEQTTLKLVPGPSVAVVVRSGILERTVPISLVPFDTTLNQDMKAVSPATGINTAWLSYIMRALEQTMLRECRKAGTTVASLEYERLLNLRIPVPPSAEQERIAEALSALLADTGAANAQLARLLRAVEALRDSVLRAFLPQEGEATMTIGEAADLGSGATPAKGDAGYYSGGQIPWLTSGDLNRRFLTEARQFITERAIRETAVKLWPAGTLLVAMYGEGKTRGQAARLDFPSTTNQACAAIRLKTDAPVSLDFLHGFFDATYHRNRLLSAGGVQPNLSLKVIRGISFPVRPREEQDVLVATYEAFLEQQTLLHHGLAALRRKVQAFERRSLLHAYAGRLVAQNSSDEPADLLMKRIATERAGSASASGQAGRTVRKPRTRRAPKTEETSE